MRVGASLILCLAAATSGAMAADKKPNVLIFLSDDVGWAEYGFQGGKDIPTPNIDSIAKNGIRFPQGYVAATYCSPSRAGLMTGRYPTRFGHEFNSVAAQSGLSLKETTMADRFHELGYATCAIGKWHLGNKLDNRPTKRGFDEFFGTLGNTPFYHPTQFVDSRVSNDVQPIEDEKFYTTDEYAKRAVDWIGKQKEGQPWLLYVPFNAQHAPLQAPEEYLDRFKDIPDEKRRTFAAMMYAMDNAVGKILGKVRDCGEEENTLVFFFSDNGGPTRSTTSNNLPLRGFKMTTWEGGSRVPFCCQWKGTLPAGKTYENPIMNLDILPTALAAAGVDAKPEWKLDGVNLLPYLTGKNSERPHETMYWRYGDQWAIRQGDWKLVAGNGGDKTNGELINLADDISEAKNLAAEKPEKVRELKALWDKWSAEQRPLRLPKKSRCNNDNASVNASNVNRPKRRRDDFCIPTAKDCSLKSLFTNLIAVCSLVGLLRAADAKDANADAAAARRQALMHSYGTYAGSMRTPDGRMNTHRLLEELAELRANNYNWLIGAPTDWDDLHTFLPLAKEHGIRIWVTVLPPSESVPHSARYSEPFRLDYVKWAAGLAALSAREPALVAWSIDDFVHNLKKFTPEEMQKIIAAQRAQNPNFAFAPCVYYKQATPEFASQYREFLDGILFPYRSESTKAGFADATQVVPEIKTLRERFGSDFPIVVDIYATRHSKLGPSPPEYVEQVLKLAHPATDGVHIYRHLDKNDPAQREKYEIVRRAMNSWAEQPAKPSPTR